MHKPCMTHIGVAHGLWASLECALLGVVLLFLACVVKIVWKIRLSATTLECAFARRVLVSCFCCL